MALKLIWPFTVIKTGITNDENIQDYQRTYCINCGKLRYTISTIEKGDFNKFMW